ncbi:DUF3052 family protein [Hydrogenophaga sp. A37]|uniref:DUF3052 family protein n=1 Tax=Hydrogenophaga sp. A37 TaxID=1945864 RepID=UPI000985026B|nr:DUF3052 family protein [Hydrogenophaga sp. A37]OOG83245.1 DUF3052 domain-containing protein [Hydrogenophaga sp. A37]
MTTTGYSGTPLAKKLGFKPSARVCVIGAPDGYEALLHPLPEGLVFEQRADALTDLVHLFTTDKAELAQQLGDLRQRLNPAAALWVSWPKKASKVPTDITEDTIRELGLPMGWVDIKVCAVSDVWSGLKLVVRKTLR